MPGDAATVPSPPTSTLPRDVLPVSDAGGAERAKAPEASRAVASFHIVGRFDTRDPTGPRLGWAGTEIRARFSGSDLEVELGDTGISHYDVTVDGGPPRFLAVTGPRRTYDLASGLGPGTHEVVLTKRTETFAGVTQLFGFLGDLIPTEAPSGRRIELIGDSITCGFGVLGPDATCDFSPDTQSEPMAWGALAAKQLGALRMVTAVSGMGVLRNFDGSTTDTMPERYDRSLADDPTSTWTHDVFEPDVVVVNLGTNDFAGGKGDPGPDFQLAYTKLLTDVRARHAGAWIVAATSPMLGLENGTKLRSYVEGAIAARVAAGDTKLSLLQIGTQSELDGYGCGYHPSITTHQKMAMLLVDHVKKQMAW